MKVSTRSFLVLFVALLSTCTIGVTAAERVRLIVETDAGGDPDDEQSMVRFLLYSNEWDVEGIIANRPRAREKENLNPIRTGLGIVQAEVRAYGTCREMLVQHDPRYPTLDYLWARTVPGYDDVDDGVKLIIAAVDRDDPRPVWFGNWGTDQESGVSCLKRALDRVRRERGQAGYERFKSRLRLSTADKFGEHTMDLPPAFPIWVDTFRPTIGRQRWYWEFSRLTATAGGFDIERDCRAGHGPLGALYPTNTNPKQKEGDTMSFLYLMPTGMNDPEHPEWGSWAGRYGRNPEAGARPYYWANQEDTWNGTTNRSNTLARWAEHLQNDFRTRLEWCVKDFAHANHPPQVKLRGDPLRHAKPGERVELDVSESSDPDHNTLRFQWIYYPEPGTFRGRDVEIHAAASAKAWILAPPVTSAQTLHFIAIVSDDGSPSLTRYARVIMTLQP
jgi:hypothetical protein